MFSDFSGLVSFKYFSPCCAMLSACSVLLCISLFYFSGFGLYSGDSTLRKLQEKTGKDRKSLAIAFQMLYCPLNPPRDAEALVHSVITEGLQPVSFHINRIIK